MLIALQESSRDKPVDAYGVAKAAGVTPMQAGRTLYKLHSEGYATTEDPLESANDLATRFFLARQAA